MTGDQSSVRRFRATAMGRPNGGHAITIPFDPGEAWGRRDRYHVEGTLGGHRFRAELVNDEGAWSLRLGPAWCRTPGFQAGDEVEVVVALEGPQSTTLGADVAAAFAADPAAARFFDSLPSFYRKNQARWIAGAKRPETRAARVAETVDLARQRLRER